VRWVSSQKHFTTEDTEVTEKNPANIYFAEGEVNQQKLCDLRGEKSFCFYLWQ
jgi:hypothetical protein